MNIAGLPPPTMVAASTPHPDNAVNNGPGDTNMSSLTPKFHMLYDDSLYWNSPSKKTFIYIHTLRSDYCVYKATSVVLTLCHFPSLSRETTGSRDDPLC